MLSTEEMCLGYVLLRAKLDAARIMQFDSAQPCISDSSAFAEEFFGEYMDHLLEESAVSPDELSAIRRGLWEIKKTGVHFHWDSLERKHVCEGMQISHYGLIHLRGTGVTHDQAYADFAARCDRLIDDQAKLKQLKVRELLEETEQRARMPAAPLLDKGQAPAQLVAEGMILLMGCFSLTALAIGIFLGAPAIAAYLVSLIFFITAVAVSPKSKKQ